MDWGKMFGDLIETGSKIAGAGLGAAAVGVVINQWMKIENPSTLRLTIRNDIRDYEAETVEATVNILKQQIKNYRMTGDHEASDQAILVRETLIEEAERLHII